MKYRGINIKQQKINPLNVACLDKDGVCRCEGYKNIKVKKVTVFNVVPFPYEINYDSLQEAKKGIDFVLDNLIKNIPCSEEHAQKLFKEN